jgi:rare lipoprotein A
MEDMDTQRKKRPRTLGAMKDFALGSGTRNYRARTAMLVAALGVAATMPATVAPSVPRTAAPKSVAETPAVVKPVKHHWYEIGKATWYGGDFNGKKTASGAIYNENELTCAHRSLPLGSLVRVTNLENHRSTLVKVTDRGPWVQSAMLDLSHAAAEKLGFSGTAKVGIEQVKRADLGKQELAELRFPAAATARAGRAGR